MVDSTSLIDNRHLNPCRLSVASVLTYKPKERAAEAALSKNHLLISTKSLYFIGGDRIK